MNTITTNNYSRVKLSFLLVPLCIIVVIILFLYKQDALSAGEYVKIQKEYFFGINAKLSQCSTLQHNITQLGDALIILSMLSVLILYASKIWEALLSASLISLIFSGGLKNLIDVPRPATAFGEETFTIIGKTAIGFSSLPSGHSITIFTTLTVLMFAFLPKKLTHRALWCSSILIFGFFVAFSRVAVGAHHPLDVILGCCIGNIAGILGIYISRKYAIFTWISNKKYYFIFIILFIVCSYLIINDIRQNNLFIYYISLICLLISLFLITKTYVKNFRETQK